MNPRQTKEVKEMRDFKKIIRDYYKKHRRSFPWRENISPYRVVISEIMLQQTQAPRVVPKFESFMRKFPDFEALAGAPLRDVLAEWQGLGYNRRGVQLKKLAEMVVNKNTKDGENEESGESKKDGLPREKEALMELPGIGPNTAGSVLAFAYNIPEPFIETNIRSVFIHFFFKKSRAKIDDKNILKLVKKSLTGTNAKNPREWYYALMDYGVYLKSMFPNPSRRSRHHVRQSPFEGSNRQLRAQILRNILEKPQTAAEICRKYQDYGKIGKMKKNGTIKKVSAELIIKNLADLAKEGFIVEKDRCFHIL